MNILNRYNQFYNDECSGLSHGTPISMEHLQSITIECAIKAFARKYNYKESIPVEDLLYLAKELMRQGEETVDKVSAEHRKVGEDAL
jgi:tRNA threonylcarbamoyladenosine modification (KEOPS) complex Cgi121 subunit